MKKTFSLLLAFFTLLLIVGCSGSTKDLNGISSALKSAGMQVETIQRDSNKLYDDFEKVLSPEAMTALLITFDDGEVAIDVIDIRGKDKEERISAAYKVLGGSLEKERVVYNSNLALVFSNYTIDAYQNHKDEIVTTFKNY